MRVVDLRASFDDPRLVVPRAEIDVATAAGSVREIIADVHTRGDDAVLAWGQRLDGVSPRELRVPPQVLADSLADLDSGVRAALEETISRVRIVHEDQTRADVTTEVVAGGHVTERWVPVDRVGLYVPGGRAVYPSSVVMNVVPAQIAGVRSLAVFSPPQIDNDGWPHPVVLAACELLGVSEVYACGGAQAIAAAAYGTKTVERVNMVTGPGNIWVTAAKRELRGVIGIDSEAGPTEIMIIADDTANAHYVASDLISQAEHDTIAASVLVTNSLTLVDAVQKALESQVATTKHSERIEIALTGPQSAIVLVRDIDQAIEVANAYAAEHLEIHTADAAGTAAQIRNAGAIFVGPYSPVSLGDYCAGSNHVLPTGGCACFSSGLSVQTFLKGVHVIEYDKESLLQVADAVGKLARAEDLPAHAEAVEIRATQ